MCSGGGGSSSSVKLKTLVFKGSVGNSAVNIGGGSSLLEEHLSGEGGGSPIGDITAGE